MTRDRGEPIDAAAFGAWKAAQYPRLLAACVGVFPTNTYRAVLWRVGGAEGAPTYTELARCRHFHRNRRKALECAELLARLDGAPADVEG